jgi:Ca2+-transporting ATPase
MGSVTLVTQIWTYYTDWAHWRSMTFTVLALSQMGHVLAIRTDYASLFRIGVGSNRPLLGAVALTLLLQLATLYVPALNGVFGTEPLSGPELLLSLALSSVVFVAVEIEKAVKRARLRRVGDHRRHLGHAILF